MVIEMVAHISGDFQRKQACLAHEAVSYTHLDVYKRQPQRLALRTPYTSTLTTKYMLPMTRRRLDVYKRQQ